MFWSQQKFLTNPSIINQNACVCGYIYLWSVWITITYSNMQFKIHLYANLQMFVLSDYSSIREHTGSQSKHYSNRTYLHICTSNTYHSNDMFVFNSGHYLGLPINFNHPFAYREKLVVIILLRVVLINTIKTR